MSRAYADLRASPDWDASAGLLLAEEVAEAFGVSPRTVYRWVREGRIAWLRLPGGDYRFSARWLQDRTHG